MLQGRISKLYIIHGIKIINAIIIGNNIVHEKDISWSKRILGKDALTHIKVNTIKLAFSPKDKPYIAPSTIGDSVILLKIKIWSVESKDSGT